MSIDSAVSIFSSATTASASAASTGEEKDKEEEKDDDDEEAEAVEAAKPAAGCCGSADPNCERNAATACMHCVNTDCCAFTVATSCPR